VHILDEIIASIRDDAPVEEVQTGSRSSLVRGSGVGLAYRHKQTADEPAARWSKDTSVCQLALLARSSHPVEASIGIAAINSAIRPDPSVIEDGNGRELILEHGAGRDVTLVGHFDFVDELREKVRNLWVLELHPEQGDLPASEAPRVIPRSDVVAITGSSLVNHTLGELLDLARGRYVILLGASTIFSPLLFDCGVAAICGAVVQDLDEVRRCVLGGIGFRHSTGIRKVIWRR
jgi:uncharacterized protein